MANCDLHIPDDKLKSLLTERIDFKRDFLAALQDDDVRRELTKAVTGGPLVVVGTPVNHPVDEVAVKAPYTPQAGEWVAWPSSTAIDCGTFIRAEGDWLYCSWAKDGRTLPAIKSQCRPATNAEVADVLGLKKGDVFTPWKKDAKYPNTFGKYFTVDHIYDNGRICSKWGEHHRHNGRYVFEPTEIHLVSRAEPATATRPFQWRDLVEIVGADCEGDKHSNMITTVCTGEHKKSVGVAVPGWGTVQFPSTSLRLLRTAEEVVKWAGGAK